MLRYVIKRVLLVIPTLLGAAALVFVLMRLIPGDVCVVRLGSSGGTFDPKAIALCHAELGMDRPVLIQFIDFVWGCMRLDFGTSMWSGMPVTTEILARLPIYARTSRYLFVHAGIVPGLPLSAQADFDMLWIREPFLSEGPGLDLTVVHGHTPDQDFQYGPRRIGIDTGAFATGTLKALHIGPSGTTEV